MSRHRRCHLAEVRKRTIVTASQWARGEAVTQPDRRRARAAAQEYRRQGGQEVGRRTVAALRRLARIARRCAPCAQPLFFAKSFMKEARVSTQRSRRRCRANARMPPTDGGLFRPSCSAPGPASRTRPRLGVGRRPHDVHEWTGTRAHRATGRRRRARWVNSGTRILPVALFDPRHTSLRDSSHKSV